MKAFKAEQVINGSWGEVWIDNDYLAQVIALKAEVNPLPNSNHNGAKTARGTENDRIGDEGGNKAP